VSPSAAVYGRQKHPSPIRDTQIGIRMVPPPKQGE
jgi:hypothetical protein